MAFIIGQEEQQAALKEIRATRKEMESTNKFLEHSNEKGKYTIIYTSDDGTRCSAVAQIDDKADIDRFVLHHKQLVSDRMVKLAKDNRIMLDIEEKQAFGLDLTKEEQEELENRILAELEEAEKAAVATEEEPSDAAEEPENADDTDKPFFNDPDAIPG